MWSTPVRSGWKVAERIGTGLREVILGKDLDQV